MSKRARFLSFNSGFALTSVRAFAVLVALFVLSGVAPAHAEEASPKPSLWERMKTGARQGVEQSQLGQQRRRNSQPAAASHEGPLFEPISPSTGGRFEGLFANDDHTQAQRGQLQWPRAAITFTEYGSTLNCWTVRARIWSSANKSEEETFRICDAPVTSTDDLGRATRYELTPVMFLNNRMRGVRTMALAHTGAQRTEGPNPPLEPWGVNIAREGDGDRNSIAMKLDSILPRLGLVAGYVTEADMYAGERTIATGFQDPRMWFVRFDPKGNRDIDR